MVQPAQVLSYLSRLAPTPGQQRTKRHWSVVASAEDMAWYPGQGLPGEGTGTMVAGKRLLRLASADALQSERLLRVGWIWLAGKVKLVQDGERSARSINCCLPVFVRTVSFSGNGPNLAVHWHSDVSVHPNFADIPGFVEMLEPEMARFTSWAAPSSQAEERLRAALALVCAQDWQHLTSTDFYPFRYRGSANPLLMHGTGIYMDRASKPPVMARHLQRWSAVDVESTAFARLYGLVPDPEPGAIDQQRTSPLPLNERQRSAIERIDQEPVVTIAGPPGTGKSHAAVAVACEAIHRGRTVLIATKSDHAAESVCEILNRYETPTHVRFGTDQHRHAAAERLGAQTNVIDKQQRSAIERASSDRQMDLDRTLGQIRSTLQREERFRQAVDWRTKNAGAAAHAPGVLDDRVDISRAERLLELVRSPSWWNRVRRRRREEELRAFVRARDASTLDEIATAISVGRADADARSGLDNEAVNLASDWTQLEAAETACRAATAALLVAEQSKMNRAERRNASTGAAALSAVLRSGKERRTRVLSESVGSDFLNHAPLWVGTLDEIESTLPAMAGLFDLVIFDEASQIDQLAATPALCRAERVVVVGDPKQLRHVSFVADSATDAALEAEGLAGDSLAQVLDVRRNSLFDVAAAAGPTTQLDEHFRSVPHLIDFSNQRFYDSSLRLMTQHPRVEGVDAIWHGRVEGQRDKSGVVTAEIDTIITHLQHMITTGDHRSVGVVTPFRAQADALLQAAVLALPLADIRSLDLRVGTVHGLQGTERDLVMVSLGLGEDDLGRSLRFVQDPHLFNVMITRARGQIAVYHSFDPANLPAGLLRDWFLTGDLPPGGVSGEKASDAWTAQLAQDLAAAGLRVVADYPVAGWTVDLAVGEGDWAFGVETGVHPDGIDAHIERHLTLRRAGWHLVDAFESRWLLRSGDVVARLATLAEQRRRAADE